jgi:hypothetical protein
MHRIFDADIGVKEEDIETEMLQLQTAACIFFCGILTLRWMTEQYYITLVGRDQAGLQVWALWFKTLVLTMCMFAGASYS